MVIKSMTLITYCFNLLILLLHVLNFLSFFSLLNVLLRNSGVYRASDIQTAVKALDDFEINAKSS